MIIQLYKKENINDQILASDGLLYIDGRLSKINISKKIELRNESMKKNFPHK